MRYARGHKDKTRERIVALAARRVRKEGIEAVGVAGLMAGLGLTHGGFYSHFSSKAALVDAALDRALERGRAALARAGARGGLAAMVRLYLSPLHRDMPEHGCPFVSLSGELARRPVTERAALGRHLDALIALLAEHLPGPAETRHRRAACILAQMAGTLSLARLMTDDAASRAVLEDGIAAALALAGMPAEA